MVPEKISMTPQRRAYLGRSVPGAAVGSVLGENHPFRIILQSENDQGSIFGGIFAERGHRAILSAWHGLFNSRFCHNGNYNPDGSAPGPDRNFGGNCGNLSIPEMRAFLAGSGAFRKR